MGRSEEIMQVQRTGGQGSARVAIRTLLSGGSRAPGENDRHRALLIAVSLVLGLLVSGCISKAVYHPSPDIRHTPRNTSLPFEDVTFTASDGVKLTGWWIPAPNPRGTVLFCHGNGGNISTCLDTVVIINRLGLNLLMFDYRGYGRSEGSPSEQGTYADADAAWDFLVKEKGIKPSEVIVWGRSLGGPIAAKTAWTHAPGLVIMESTFTSLHQLVADRFFNAPSWLLSSYAYDTRQHLGHVRAPVLVIHSPDDEVVPFSHGKALYEALPSRGSFLEIRGSHNRGYVDSVDIYQAAISEFIAKNIPAKEASIP
jgi:fermentation-respiration switch protein FrsA (DUF1100 family)